jgi:hypothetical protein
MLIAGTGFWAHRTFNATVVDVRSSDDTIKVQFPDKGYKRYPRAWGSLGPPRDPSSVF